MLSVMDKKSPLISVIVPVYKVEKWLKKCLDSICKQTYSNLEIICVDDASPDRCGEILDAYAEKDARIKVIHQKNMGLSGARNTGLEHATGEWVTGVDSDDCLFPGIYAAAIPHLKDDVDMLAFGTEKADESERSLPPEEQLYFALPQEGSYPIHAGLPQEISACFWNKLWRRSIIEQHHLRFPQGLIHEDEAFIRLFLPFARRWYSFPCVGYRYLQREGSIMNTLTEAGARQRTKHCLAIADYLMNFYQAQGLNDVFFEFLIRYGVQIRYHYAGNRSAELTALTHRWRQLFPHRSHDYRMLYIQRQSPVSRFFDRRDIHQRLIHIGCLPLLRFYYNDKGQRTFWETPLRMLLRRMFK